RHMNSRICRPSASWAFGSTECAWCRMGATRGHGRVRLCDEVQALVLTRMPSHQADQLELRAHIEFSIDCFEMVAHCVCADHEVLSNLFDAPPSSQSLDDLVFSCAQATR